MAVKLSSWDLIARGKFEAACEAADLEAAEHSTLRLGNKVTALLNLRKFGEAVEVCDTLISAARSHGGTAAHFIKSGVAHWLLHEHADAIRFWRDARQGKYVDAAGGLTAPMLLVFAAIRTQDSPLMQEAFSLIRKARGVKSGIGWPSPLGSFLLGHTSESELVVQISSHPVLRQRQLCTAHFHIGVSHLPIDSSLALSHMEAATRGSPSILLESEYYLAKGELLRFGKIHMNEWSRLPKPSVL